MSFLVRMEAPANPRPPEELMAELLAYARSFRCGVIATVNGIDAWAYPEETEAAVVARWTFLRDTSRPGSSLHRGRR